MRDTPRLGQDKATALKISKVLYGTPSLRAGSIEKHLRWQALTPEIRRRLGVAPDNAHDLRADAIVACMLTCLYVAGEAWTRSDGSESLEEPVGKALAAVRGSTQGA